MMDAISRLRTLIQSATRDPVAQIPDVAEAIEVEASDLLDEIEHLFEKQRDVTQEWYDEAHKQRLRANRAEAMLSESEIHPLPSDLR